MIRVKVTGVKDAQDALSKLGREKVDAVRKAVYGAALKIQEDARRNAPTNMGRLKSDIQFGTAVSKDAFDAQVYNTVDYAPFVEFGTKSKVDVPQDLTLYAQQFRGGNGGSFDELLDSIKRWAHLKGLPTEAAFPIARAIARDGVSARPYLFPAVENERPNLERKVKEAIR
jgi:HK97 gp10 family phage protein